MGVQLLAGGDQPAQRGQGDTGAALCLVGDPADDGRHEFDDGDAGPLQGVRQAPRVGQLRLAEHDHGAADEQRGQHLPDGDVEDQRSGEGEPVRLGQAEVLDLGPEVVHHAAVLHRGALGPPGGAGGEDAVAGLQGAVRGVVGGRDGHRRAGPGGVCAGCRDHRRPQFVRRLHGGTAARAVAARVAGVVEQQVGAAARQHLADPLGRPVGGDGQVDGAEALEGEERRDRVGRAVADRSDDRAGRAAGRAQHGAEPVDAGEQSGVGQGGLAVDDRGPLRRPCRGAGHSRQHTGRGVGPAAVPAQAQRAGPLRGTRCERQGRRRQGRGHEAPALW